MNNDRKFKRNKQHIRQADIFINEVVSKARFSLQDQVLEFVFYDIFPIDTFVKGLPADTLDDS